MKQIWVYADDWTDGMEFYDCKETAWLAYNRWCELNNETPKEELFNMCYYPLSETFEILTAEKVASKDYIPK